MPVPLKAKFVQLKVTVFPFAALQAVVAASLCAWALATNTKKVTTTSGIIRRLVCLRALRLRRRRSENPEGEGVSVVKPALLCS